MALCHLYFAIFLIELVCVTHGLAQAFWLPPCKWQFGLVCLVPPSAPRASILLYLTVYTSSVLSYSFCFSFPSLCLDISCGRRQWSWSWGCSVDMTVHKATPRVLLFLVEGAHHRPVWTFTFGVISGTHTSTETGCRGGVDRWGWGEPFRLCSQGGFSKESQDLAGDKEPVLSKSELCYGGGSRRSWGGEKRTILEAPRASWCRWNPLGWERAGWEAGSIKFHKVDILVSRGPPSRSGNRSLTCIGSLPVPLSLLPKWPIASNTVDAFWLDLNLI